MFFRTPTPYLYLFALIWRFVQYASRKIAFVQTGLLILLPDRSSDMLAICTSSLALAGLITSLHARKSKAIRVVQGKQVLELKKEPCKRTLDPDAQRASLASDHDQTGNLLPVIIYQATVLKLKAGRDLQPIIENTFCSSQQLYTSSKPFLWHLNSSGCPESGRDYPDSGNNHPLKHFTSVTINRSGNK